MATIDKPATHRDEISLLLDLADRQFAVALAVVTLLVPLGAYLAGDLTVLFFVHVGLGAFWFGMDFYFKFIMGPALDQASAEDSNAAMEAILPRSMVTAELLTLGVIGSGIGLADLLGYLVNPTIWVWGALGLAAGLILVGLGPLHRNGAKMVVELASESPDQDRLDGYMDRILRWGLVQTVFLLAMIVMMVGMRGV